MHRKIHTALSAHIEALYSEGQLDCFVPVMRGPIQDESRMSDPEDEAAARIIEAGKHRK